MLLERDGEMAAARAVIDKGGILLIEGGAGIGKTSLLAAASERATELGRDVLRARGSELEAGFAFGVVRQLFERRVDAVKTERERGALFAGPAAAARPLFEGELTEAHARDISFAVLHGLYWLAANLSSRRALAITVDDAHWSDTASLRWLAYLAPRLEGLPLSLLVALRPDDPGTEPEPLTALRTVASVVRPSLLSERASAAIVRSATDVDASDELCSAVWRVSGGNPFYLSELLRTGDQRITELEPSRLLEHAREGVTRHVAARLRRLDARALKLAQAIAVLGDDCELRHATALAGLDMETGTRLAAGLVRVEVLAGDEPPRFLHPIVRDAVESSLPGDERDHAHRTSARLLHTDGAQPGRVAAHLLRLRPAADPWVVERLREAAEAALESGAPQSGAELLRRALAEPPAAVEQAAVLLEAGRAEAVTGQQSACVRLEEARRLTRDPGQRAEIGLELAQVHGDLFQWMEAVDTSERALADLEETDPALEARLQVELVVAALRDARRASRILPALDRLQALQAGAPPLEAHLLVRGMAELWLLGRPASQVRTTLETAYTLSAAPAANWDTRGPGLWALVFAEGYDPAADVLKAMHAQVERSGSARGLFTTYVSLGLLRLRLGALPEADSAARVALRVIQSADFAPGLPLGVTVLADVAIEAGELDEAQALLDGLPRDPPAGLASVQPVAARGRLRLAQGRPAEALVAFEQAGALFGPGAWGMDMKDNGFLHVRSGTALALLALDRRGEAQEMARSELTEARAFGASRALGVALRVAGLAQGGEEGLDLLKEAVQVHRKSPALLERARSLADYGAALRRVGRRAAAKDPLLEALDLASRCAARPLAARIRDELKAIGARPRREWRSGVEALTPSELRVARLAADGRTNREIAQALYVTTKTVEGHLARVYMKLDITSREELHQGLEGEKTRVSTL